MKQPFFTLLVAGCLLAGNSFAQTAPAETAPKAAPRSAIATEIQPVITKIQAKLKDNKKTEADLAPELKELDAIYARHKAEKTDEVIQILLVKAGLYQRVLDNEAKGKEIYEQIKRDYPDSKITAMLKKQEEQEAEIAKADAKLAVGLAFPDFKEQDTNGKPLSLTNYKGKVVLVDFWATWCGPCVAELPNVLKAYEKYHANGFEIVGISLDENREKLSSFVKEKNMPWPQFFDGQGWENKLAQQYTIRSIPATFLLDREGKIIAKGDALRGEKLDAAVAAALAKK